MSPTPPRPKKPLTRPPKGVTRDQMVAELATLDRHIDGLIATRKRIAKLLDPR